MPRMYDSDTAPRQHGSARPRATTSRGYRFPGLVHIPQQEQTRRRDSRFFLDHFDHMVAGSGAGTIAIVSREKVLEVKSVVKADGIAVVDRVREKLDAVGVAKAAAPRQTPAAPAAVPSASAVAPAPEPRVSQPASIEIIPPPPSVPPGWYPESADAVLVRYWNGAQWTDHTAPRAVP